MTTPNYCTRTPKPRTCAGCSLVNYGLDCANNPMPASKPRKSKQERALAKYNGHRGSATVAHVERNIESAYPTAYRDLTGVQYGRLMSVANTSYHDGRASAGAELVDDDLVIVRGSKCYPLALLARMDENPPKKAKKGDMEALFNRATFYRDREAARAAIAKSKGV